MPANSHPSCERFLAFTDDITPYVRLWHLADDARRRSHVGFSPVADMCTVFQLSFNAYQRVQNRCGVDLASVWIFKKLDVADA